ncbi:glucosamine-6-phosphate deaminase [Oscillatoria laete-virens NRMC-F 0139]|nr:glucosamine-6-phosphate deaminase [Oscillatoria laete-virens]MDL5053168.1 glucosamine-6-phosphate deaminase [Oscillatoria laete-virens NRMC-F 0139]
MEVIIKPTATEASLIAARLIARQIRVKPTSVLGLATGNTPLETYRHLVRMHKEEGLDFSKVTTFNLDEYVGLAPDHPASYHSFMWENLFRHINIRRAHVHIPNGLADDIPDHCREYEDKIRACGGIDIQLLGIGGDGHIGFNEPSSSLSSRTRMKTLTQRTIRDNAPFFGSEDQVPLHVLTMGIGTIMDSRSCILLAFGQRKAAIVAKMVEGPITAMVPASALQWHESTTVLMDESASQELTRKEYYQWVYANKPHWQREGLE